MSVKKEATKVGRGGVSHRLPHYGRNTRKVADASGLLDFPLDIPACAVPTR